MHSIAAKTSQLHQRMPERAAPRPGTSCEQPSNAGKGCGIYITVIPSVPELQLAASQLDSFSTAGGRRRR